MKEETIKEIYEIVKNHQPTAEEEKMCRDEFEKLTLICGKVSVVNKIVEYAKQNGIDLMGKGAKEPKVHSFLKVD